MGGSPAADRLHASRSRLPQVSVQGGLASLVLPTLILGTVGVLYAPVLAHGVDVWTSDQELSFGFCGPPVALALVWFRRRRLQSSMRAGSAAGLVPLLAGLAMLLVGASADIRALMAVSLLPTLLGVAAYLRGLELARQLAVPTALVTAALSLYRGLFNSLGFTLQELTARGAAGLVSLLGGHVERSGVDLFVGGMHFVVAQACSGMDSLIALLYLGLLVVTLASASWPRRLALMLAVVPIVLAANVIRVSLVLLLSPRFQDAITQGLGHELLSASVFLVASLLFGFMVVGLKCLPDLDATR
jgi:exosortase